MWGAGRGSVGCEGRCGIQVGEVWGAGRGGGVQVGEVWGAGRGGVGCR